VLGRRLSCLKSDSYAVFCLAKTGQLAFDTSGAVNARQFDLLSLTMTVSKSAFSLPAKPTRVQLGWFPNLCRPQDCPSPGVGM
jgi:hypothetical protein